MSEISKIDTIFRLRPLEKLEVAAEEECIHSERLCPTLISERKCPIQ